MPSNAEVQLIMTARDEISRTLEQVSGSMANMAQAAEQHTSGIQNAFSTAFGMIAAQIIPGAITALKDGITSFATSAMESETVMARLDATLQATGRAAAKQAAEYAGAMGKMITVSDVSAKEAEKATGEYNKMAAEMARLTASVKDQEMAWAKGGKQTESAGVRLAQTKMKIGELTTEMDKAAYAMNGGTKSTISLAQSMGLAPSVIQATKEQIMNLADGMSQFTRFDDEAIISASSLMLQFRNVGKDVFDQAITSAADLAEAMGMDLSAASRMLGKALEDPGEGLMMLKRAGISFTDAQIKTFKAMSEGGKTAEAQKLILDEVANSIGGVAKAMGSTTAGQMTIMKNNFANVKEEIGAAFLPTLNAAFGAVSEFALTALPQVKESAAALMMQLAPLGAIIGQMVKSFQDAGGGLPGIFAGIRTALSSLFVGNIGGGFDQLAKGVMGGMEKLKSGDYKGAAQSVLSGIQSAFAAVDFGAIAKVLGITALKDQIVARIQGIDWSAIPGQIGKGIASAAGMIIDWTKFIGLDDVLDQIVTFFETIDWSVVAAAIRTGISKAAIGVGNFAIGLGIDPAVIASIGDNLATAGGAIEEFKNQAISTFNWITNEGQPILVGLAASIMAVLVPSLYSAAAGALTMGTTATGSFVAMAAAAIPAIVATVAAAAPLILMAVGIGVAVGLLSAAWKNNWGGIREITASVVAWLQVAFANVVTWISTAWTNVRTWTQTAWTNINTTITNVLTWISTTIQTALATISGVMQGATNLWNMIWAKVSSVFRAIWDPLWNSIQNVVKTVTSIVSSVMQAFQSAREGDWYAFGANLRKAWDKLWDGIVTTFNTIKTTLIESFETLKATIIMSFEVLKAKVLFEWELLKSRVIAGVVELKLNWNAFWDALPGNLEKIWTNIKTAIKTGVNNVLDAIKQFASNLKTEWDNLWKSAETGTVEVGPKILTAIQHWAFDLTKQFQGMIKDWIKFGGDMIGGLVQGIVNSAEDAARNVASVIRGLLGAARIEADAQSPAIEWAKLGVDMMLGLAQGFQEGQPATVNAMSEMIAGLGNALQSITSAVSGMGGATVGDIGGFVASLRAAIVQVADMLNIVSGIPGSDIAGALIHAKDAGNVVEEMFSGIIEPMAAIAGIKAMPSIATLVQFAEGLGVMITGIADAINAATIGKAEDAVARAAALAPMIKQLADVLGISFASVKAPPANFVAIFDQYLVALEYAASKLVASLSMATPEFVKSAELAAKVAPLVKGILDLLNVGFGSMTAPPKDIMTQFEAWKMAVGQINTLLTQWLSRASEEWLETMTWAAKIGKAAQDVLVILSVSLENIKAPPKDIMTRFEAWKTAVGQINTLLTQWLSRASEEWRAQMTNAARVGDLVKRVFEVLSVSFKFEALPLSELMTLEDRLNVFKNALSTVISSMNQTFGEVGETSPLLIKMTNTARVMEKAGALFGILGASFKFEILPTDELMTLDDRLNRFKVALSKVIASMNQTFGEVEADSALIVKMTNTARVMKLAQEIIGVLGIDMTKFVVPDLTTLDDRLKDFLSGLTKAIDVLATGISDLPQKTQEAIAAAALIVPNIKTILDLLGVDLSKIKAADPKVFDAQLSDWINQLITAAETLADNLDDYDIIWLTTFDKAAVLAPKIKTILDLLGVNLTGVFVPPNFSAQVDRFTAALNVTVDKFVTWIDGLPTAWKSTIIPAAAKTAGELKSILDLLNIGKIMADFMKAGSVKEADLRTATRKLVDNAKAALAIIIPELLTIQTTYGAGLTVAQNTAKAVMDVVGVFPQIANAINEAVDAGGIDYMSVAWLMRDLSRASALITSGGNLPGMGTAMPTELGGAKLPITSEGAMTPTSKPGGLIGLTFNLFLPDGTLFASHMTQADINTISDVINIRLGDMLGEGGI